MLSFCTVIYSSRYVCYKNKDSYYRVRCFIAVIQGDVMSLFYRQQCLLTKRTGTLQRTVYSYVCSMVVEITQAHTHCCSSSYVCLCVCVFVSAKWIQTIGQHCCIQISCQAWAWTGDHLFRSATPSFFLYEMRYNSFTGLIPTVHHCTCSLTHSILVLLLHIQGSLWRWEAYRTHCNTQNAKWFRMISKKIVFFPLC